MLRLVRAAAVKAAKKKQPPPPRCWNGAGSILSVACTSTSTSSTTSSTTSTGNVHYTCGQQQQQHCKQRRYKSSMAAPLLEGDSLSEPDPTATRPATGAATASSSVCKHERERRHRLERVRNVGILAHVDAGKTTVTERMLALAGVVRHVGRVDTGNTVTDYLPQERERGITIQSAAIQFDWGWHHPSTSSTSSTPSKTTNSGVDSSGDTTNDRVRIALIDTPGHVDFSVEVHRSVAVLDGAVLVVDAVAGVQAQTETVWRAMQDHSPEGNALPSLIVVNKMDKEGCHYANAIQTIRHKLPGANPLPIQLPLFRLDRPPSDDNNDQYNNSLNLPTIVVGGGMPFEDCLTTSSNGNISNSRNAEQFSGLGEFAGVLDLIHMRAIVYPETNSNSSKSVEECVPDVYPLLLGGGSSSVWEANPEQDALIDPSCPLTQAALEARHALVEQLAGDCGDGLMEEYYLEDAMPSPQALQQSIRTATLNHTALPVLAAAALRGKGLEPLMDSIADLLPSPLDRPAPCLISDHSSSHRSQGDLRPAPRPPSALATTAESQVTLGHPLNQELLAFAFKVCHLSGGRGGSGDGRVVFCRVYSGTLNERDVLHVVSPPTKGEEGIVAPSEPRKERVGGMLDLKGGLFTNKENGVCYAGEVCALVGLKSVVTGDTLVLAKKKLPKKQQKKAAANGKDSSMVCLAGVASPKPVLQVRLETETQQGEARLIECLQLLAVEDPSLCIEESDSGTLLSGLGELHVEVTLDRLHREFGLSVQKGSPRVAYRETLLVPMETAGGGLLNYDKTVGDTRLQAAVHLRLQPLPALGTDCGVGETQLPHEPTVTVGPRVVEFLQLKPDATHEECMAKCGVYKALVQGCLGALRRGPVGSYAMANMTCHVEEIDAEEGLSGLYALPGAIRAAAMNAVAITLSDNVQDGRVLEPSMSVEISCPNEMVGTVLSDLTSRRGSVQDVITGNEDGKSTIVHQKTLVRGQVPLVEILGYANILRSLTAGEGNFTAEYKGHSVCSEVPQ